MINNGEFADKALEEQNLWRYYKQFAEHRERCREVVCDLGFQLGYVVRWQKAIGLAAGRHLEKDERKDTDKFVQSVRKFVASTETLARKYGMVDPKTADLWDKVVGACIHDGEIAEIAHTELKGRRPYFARQQGVWDVTKWLLDTRTPVDTSTVGGNLDKQPQPQPAYPDYVAELGKDAPRGMAARAAIADLKERLKGEG